MIFRQLFDPQSSTYTYLLADEASLADRLYHRQGPKGMGLCTADIS